MARTPVLGGRVPPAPPRINPGPATPFKQWVFSFRYFREYENFGLGQQDSGWFVALLEKLGDLSRETIAELNTNPAKRRQWRFHEIEWGAKNVPLSRSDFNWIAAEYLKNEEEFPFQQFQISKALGRVIGFKDENGVFNVVLLDPLHNMQPSSYSDYKIRKTEAAETHLAKVMAVIEAKIVNCGAGCRCRAMYGEFQAEITAHVAGNTVLVSLADELFAKVNELVQCGIANSIAEIIEVGVAEFR